MQPTVDRRIAPNARSEPLGGMPLEVAALGSHPGLAALDRLTAFGTLVMDLTGIILDASGEAVAALRQAAALAREPGGRFTLRDPAGRLLRRLLASSMHAGALHEGSIQVRRGAGRPPLSLVVVPAPAVMASWFSHEACWLGLLFDPEARVEVSVELVRASLGVSAREAQIVALLVSGLSLNDIARRLGVSVHTVRAQLKSVFLKTGVSSQIALVRKVMAGPAAKFQKNVVIEGAGSVQASLP